MLIPVSQNNGTYLVSKKLTEADVYSVAVSLGGVAVKDSPVEGIQVYPNVPQAQESDFVDAHAEIIVNHLTKYKILPKDLYGNVVRKAGLHYYLELLNEKTKELSEVEAVYTIDGYEASFIVKDATTYSALIKLAQYGGLRATYYKTIDFMNPVEVENLNVHIGQLPNKYTRIDSTIDFDWTIYGPAIEDFPSDFFSVKWEGKFMTPYSEYYKFIIVTDNAIRLTIDGKTIIDTISIRDTINPSTEHSAYYALNSEILYDIVLEYIETRGSSEIHLYWQSDSIPRQIIPSTNLYNILYSHHTPIIATAIPAPTDPHHCTINPDHNIAVIGVTKTIIIQARDQYSNLQLGNNDLFTVSITGNGEVIEGIVSVVSDGTYEAGFTLLTSGDYSLRVFVQASGASSSIEIMGSPFTVVCATSSTNPSKTHISGPGLASANAGVTTNFTVITYDSDNNQRTSGGDIIDVSLTNGKTTLTYNSISVTDQGNGIYTVQYVITDASAAYTLTVIVNGNTGSALVRTVEAVAGVPSPVMSTIVKVGNVKVGAEDVFSVYAKDSYGNILIGGVNFVSKISGAFGEKYFTGTSTGSSEGKYDTKFIIVSNDKDICGHYYVYSYFLEQGIRGAYYTNIWMSGDYAMQRLDKKISFNWGTNQIIPNLASDYVGIRWEGYIKPSTTEDYTFHVTSNDGIRVYINGELVIDNYITINAGEMLIDRTNKISLSKDQYYPIKIFYFEQSAESAIILEWETATIPRIVIPETAFYSNIVNTPITRTGFLLTVEEKPGIVTSIKQSDKSTYSLTSVQMEWLPPKYTGCSQITNYKIEINTAGTWVNVISTANLLYRFTGLTSGTSNIYRVIASNNIGNGDPSDVITLTPGVLPSEPRSLIADSYGENFVTISWLLPLNTGYGDTRAAITSYLIEVNDGFNEDFVTLAEQSLTQYTHQKLILGHSYKYRVKAKNYLGYGAYSTVLTITPSRVPGKPFNPPLNVLSKTTKESIHILYEMIKDNGGSEIVNYNVYMDDGLGGSYKAPINNGILLTYDTSSLSLVTGRIYRFKYSGVNGKGEGPTSDEVAIILASLPAEPTELKRVVSSEIYPGDVRITWKAPSTTGGVAIDGYKVYLDNVLYANKISSSITTWNITELTVGASYTISVSAVNSVGESNTASITVMAASVPSKMSIPTIKSSSISTIEIKWDQPSFDGGSAITSYLIKRDDGPGTSFLDAISITTTSYTFSGLPANKLYFRIMIAAINIIGQGDYSGLSTFIAASLPSVPQNFLVTSQSTTQISLSWSPPSSNGGCPIEGYILYMESVEMPGFHTVFDGRSSAQVTSYSIIRPTIIAAKNYRFALQSKNCGYYSGNVTLTAVAAGRPNAPRDLAMLSIGSSSSTIVTWNSPVSNGGIPITSYNVYKNDVLFENIAGSSTMRCTLIGLTIGVTYKITLSAVNSVGESEKSVPFSLLFANPTGAPTSLSLKGAIDSITVSWQAPSIVNGDYARGYRVYMDNGMGGALSLVYDGSSYPQTLKIAITKGIQAGSRYNIEVKAINIAGEGIAAIGYVVAASTPSPPYGLRVISIIPSRTIELTWNTPSSSGGLPITNYVLNKDGVDLSITISSTTTRYVDDISIGGTIGKKFIYKLKSVNSIGDSAYSEVLIAKVGTVPNQPLDFRLINHPSNTSVTLSWSVETAINSNFITIGYRVYNMETGVLLFNGTNSAIVLQATIEGLTTGITYRLVVRAANELGESVNSNELLVMAGLTPSKLATPTLYSSSASSITIQWNNPESNGGVALTKFKVYIDIGQTGTFISYDVTDTSARTYPLPLLAEGIKVNFKMSASNPIGEGPLSDIATFIAAVVPTAPIIPTFVNSYLEDETHVTLEISWTSPNSGGTPITGYKLYGRKSDEFEFINIFDGTSRPDITTYAYKRCLIGYTYNLKLTAMNIVGESAYSPILSIIGATKPTSPRSLTVIESKKSSVTLSWNPPKNSGGLFITKYTIYYSIESPSSYSWVAIEDIAASASSYAITSLNSDTLYTFKMTATNDLGEGKETGVVTQYASDVPKALPSLSIIAGSRGLTSIGLSWSVPTSTIPVTGYEIYADNGAGSEINILVYNGKNNPSTITYIQALKTASTFNFQYVAYNAAGVSQRSAVLMITIGVLPNPPADSPKLISCSDSAIAFSWLPSGESYGATLVGYKVYANDGLVYTSSANFLSYTLSAVTGNSYVIQVSAVSSVGEGSKSQSNTFYAVSVPSAPMLTLSEVQSDACKISWTAVTPPINSLITGYVVLYDTMQGGDYRTGCNFTNNPSQLTCTIKSLTTGLKIAIKALTYNKAGKSLDSNIIYCTPTGKPGQPGIPRLITSSSTSITVKWDGASTTGGPPITKYRLYYNEEQLAPMLTEEIWIKLYEGLALQATMSAGIKPGASYTFKVQALNELNEGLFSNPATYLAASVPPAPGSFVVSSSSRTWVQLTWAKPVNVATTDPDCAGYILHTNHGNLPTFTTLVNITNGDQLFFNVTGQSTGSTYTFRLFSYNQVGLSTSYAEVQGTFSDTPAKMLPPYYISSEITGTNKVSITIGWNPIIDSGGVPLTGYILYMTSDTVETKVYDGTGDPSKLSYIVTNLVLGQKYSFHVTAVNPKEGLASDTIDLYAAILPEKIIDISVIDNSRTESCIGLQWTPPNNGGTDIILYELYSDNKTLRYAGTNTQTHICNLNTGQIYKFTIQAISKLGKGAVSESLRVLIAGLPSIPRYLRTTIVTASSITLAWETPINLGGIALSGYTIYRRLGSQSEFTRVAGVDPSKVTYKDDTVSSGVSYVYAVTSVNDISESEYSVNIKTTAMSPPGKPDPPSVIAKNRYSIQLSWNIPENNGGIIQGYKLFIQRQGDVNYSLLYEGSSLEYFVTGVSSGAIYYFRVLAKNAVGESVISEPTEGIIPVDKPLPPNNLRVISRHSGAITIKWDAPRDTGGAPLIGYVVEEAKGPADYHEINFNGNTNPAILILSRTGLDACITYSYRVYSVNIGGKGIYSSIAVISASLPNAPTNAPTVISTSKYSVTLQLSIPTDNGGCDITHYRVFASINGESFNELLTTVATTFTLSGLQTSSIYRIKYAASNKVFDESNTFGEDLLMSSTVTVMIAETPQQPANFVKGDLHYRTAVYLQWDVPLDTGGSPITSYTLEYVDSSNTNTLILDKNLHNHLVSGLIPGTTYQFRISATNLIGTSSFTDYITAVPGLIPMKPSGLAITSKGRIEITIGWTALGNEDTGGTTSNPITITYYQILLTDIVSNIQKTYTTTSNNFKFNYLTPGNSYGISILACTIIGCSEYTTEVKTIVGLVPGIPYDLKVIKQSHTEISLSWNEPYDNGGSKINGYRIAIEESGNEFIKEGIYVTSYKFTISDGLVSGKTYSFKIAAKNINGYGLWTSIVTGYSSSLPNTIAVLTATYITQYSAIISWSLLSESLSGYSTTSPSYILESSKCGVNQYSICYTTITETSYSISSYPGACMKFRMKVINNIGDSPYCNELEIIFAQAPNPPSKPILIQRISNSKNTHIKLTWTSPSITNGSPIIGFILEEYSTAWTIIYDGSINALTTTYISQVLTGTTYKYRVSARNSAGISLPSPELEVIAGTIPDKVTGVNVISKVINGISSSASLSWTEPFNGGSLITGYNVKCSHGLNELMVSTGSATTSYTMTGLNAGTVYAISIAAYNGVYETNNLEKLTLLYSDQLTIIMADVPGKIMTMISKKANSPNQIVIEWIAPLNGGASITSYSLYKSKDLNNYNLLHIGIGATYIDNEVIAGELYSYKVLATNVVGNGPVSDVWTFKAGIVTSIIRNFKVLSQSSSSITIVWDPPDHIDGLEPTSYLVMSDNGDTIFSTPTETTSTNYVKTITTNAGSKFHFKVAAKNAIGISEYSKELSVVAANTPNSPILIDTARTKTSVTVTWSKPSINGGSPILGYIIRRDNGITGVASEVVYNSTNLVQTFIHTLEGLITGWTYTIQITSINLVGESVSPSIIHVTIGTKPSKINTISCISSSSNGKISISWTSPIDIGGLSLLKYSLYIGSGSTVTPIQHNDLTNLNYEFTGLTKNAEYQISVSSMNIIGESELSNQIKCYAADLPCAPSIPILFSSTRTSVTIQWSAPSCLDALPIKEYKVYINDAESTSWSTVNCVPSPSLTSTPLCVITGLTTGTEYLVKVASINAVGSKESGIFTVIAAVAPSTPDQVTLIESTKTSITIGWRAPDDSGGSFIIIYEIYSKLAIDSENAWTLLVSVENDIFNYIHNSGLTTGSSIQYKIRCKSNFGYSDYSSVSTFVVAALPIMNAPIKTSNTKTSITIEWTVSDNGGSPITGYILSRADTIDGLYSIIYNGIGNSAITSYISLVETGHIYKFKISAINAAGIGNEIESIEFLSAITPLPPNAPTLLSATTSQIEIRLGVTSDDGGSAVIGMALYVSSTGSGSFSKVTEYLGSLQIVVLTKTVLDNYVAGGAYDICSTVINAIGESPKSDILFVTLNS